MASVTFSTSTPSAALNHPAPGPSAVELVTAAVRFAARAVAAATPGAAIVDTTRTLAAATLVGLGLVLGPGSGLGLGLALGLAP